MYATNYFESAILNLMRGTAITAPTTMYLALFQSDPTDSGTAGTEADYSGTTSNYARVPITFAEPYAQSSGSSNYVLENAADISFAEASASGNVITHVAVMDAARGGNMLLYGPLDSNLTIQSGVTPTFRAGNLQWIWQGNISAYYKQAVMNVLRGSNCGGFTPYIGFCDTNGNEFNGANYARFALTMTEPTQNPTTNVCYSSNTEQATSPIAGNDWGAVQIVKMFNAQTGGQEFSSVNIGNSYNITTGSLFGFHAGDYVVNIN